VYRKVVWAFDNDYLPGIGNSSMLDGKARQLLAPILERVAKTIVKYGISANAITLIAFVIGVLAACAIATQYLLLGLSLLLVSRLGDGLDGAVARETRKTDFGGYLDIVLDFAFYGAIPFAFILMNPAQNSIAGAALILSFYINGSSFLAYAVMAERYGMKSEARGSKSLYFVTGLAEATETIAVFVAFCIFPDWFPLIAWGFAAICLVTAFARILQVQAEFRN
jgi:phosphatidylglycerophosphate synthase